MGILMISLLLLVPIGFGISFHYEHGKGTLRVIVVIAHLVHWRIVVPTRWMRLKRGGVSATARTGFKPSQGGQILTETITPEKLVEEARVLESSLHQMLTAVDLMQVLFLGRNPNHNRAR